eukprot:1335716-Amorphochlora_amoeboformis.AAC.1
MEVCILCYVSLNEWRENLTGRTVFSQKYPTTSKPKKSQPRQLPAQISRIHMYGSIQSAYFEISVRERRGYLGLEGSESVHGCLGLDGNLNHTCRFKRKVLLESIY